MTLGDGKRKVYELLDEYGVSGEGVDSDMAAKMNDLFDISQKEIAKRQKILRFYEIERESGVTEYPMPAGFLKLRRLRRDGQITRRRYEWRGKSIVIPESEPGEFEAEYFSAPETIGPDTPDEHEFEVREDACQAMPFFVAAMVLSSDLVQDANIYLSMYQMALQELDTTLPGEDGGAVLRQSFYRC